MMDEGPHASAVLPIPIQAGAGRVVTATFRHTSGVIDLTIGYSASTEAIGTTSNHPFWSEDQKEYVQAASLEIGEQVRTYTGDTKQVVSLLPRPGPEAVFNLEVHGEHVYYVGDWGITVHNAGPSYVNNNAFRNGWDDAFSAPRSTIDLTSALKMRAYIREIESITGRKIPMTQIRELKNAVKRGNFSTKLSKSGYAKHVREYNSRRAGMRDDWAKKLAKSGHCCKKL